MEGYIIIRPITGMTSEERCNKINIELWNISRPPSTKNPNDETLKVFDEIDLEDGNWCFYVDTEYVLKVHPENNLTELISLFPNMSENEKNSLVNYIESNNEFPFSGIIPSDTNVYTFQEMLDMGYFKNTEQL